MKYDAELAFLVSTKHHHMWSEELFCDGREHYEACLLRGCNERRYYCKHTGACRLLGSFGMAKVAPPQ